MSDRDNNIRTATREGMARFGRHHLFPFLVGRIPDITVEEFNRVAMPVCVRLVESDPLGLLDGLSGEPPTAA
jgi:hypothetical protein